MRNNEAGACEFASDRLKVPRQLTIRGNSIGSSTSASTVTPFSAPGLPFEVPGYGQEQDTIKCNSFNSKSGRLIFNRTHGEPDSLLYTHPMDTGPPGAVCQSTLCLHSISLSGINMKFGPPLIFYVLPPLLQEQNNGGLIYLSYSATRGDIIISAMRMKWCP